jgi:glycosyltransferase involved in cell wall biosynthesis
MRILYYHQHFSTRDGSTGTRSYEIAKKLIKKGHHVTIICGSYQLGNTGLLSEFTNGIRRGVVDNINIIELEIPYGNHDNFINRTYKFIKFALRSSQFVFTEKYDLLFSTSTPLTAGIPGIIAKCCLRKKFIFEVRDLWPELPRALKVITNPFLLFLMSFLEWLSYHCADHCIGLSPGIVDGIVKRGVSQKKVTLISNGCDIELFKGPQSCSPWRPEGVDPSDFLAIFTGAHGIANGLDHVINLCEELKKRGRREIKVLLVGDGKLKDNLVQNARDRNLDNCLFLEPVSKNKLTGLMKSANCGLMVLANIPEFYYGTSPNKFFDYLAAGLPVINNYPGWVSDLITEFSCGIAVPPENAILFADALICLCDDRDSIKRMSDNSLSLASSMFSREKLSDLFVQVLERV